MCCPRVQTLVTYSSLGGSWTLRVYTDTNQGPLLLPFFFVCVRARAWCVCVAGVFWSYLPYFTKTVFRETHEHLNPPLYPPFSLSPAWEWHSPSISRRLLVYFPNTCATSAQPRRLAPRFMSVGHKSFIAAALHEEILAPKTKHLAACKAGAIGNQGTALWQA